VCLAGLGANWKSVKKARGGANGQDKKKELARKKNGGKTRSLIVGAEGTTGRRGAWSDDVEESATGK